MRVGNNELNRRHLRPSSLLPDIVHVMLLRYDCYYGDQIENRAVCALPTVGQQAACERLRAAPSQSAPDTKRYIVIM